MGTPPRGFNREQSAEYVGISATKFDQMVADARMPKPKRIDGRVVWRRGPSYRDLAPNIAAAILIGQCGKG
jgi:hypothetical protein